MNLLQLKASDPKLSKWVSASAGTGKTKILTDRVLRLLLQNVSFNKILCLTFTNAACSEMHERIIANLEKWSNLSADDLRSSLKNTLGKDPTRDEIFKASTLFEEYLKTEEQINIYTIHSFCQKILKKFPLESGLSPNFKIIDEIKAYQIIKKIKKQIFNLPGIEPVARFFAENFHELTINEIFNEIIELKSKILTTTNFKPENDIFSGDLLTRGLKIIEELSVYDTRSYQDVIIDPAIKELILSLFHPRAPLCHPSESGDLNLTNTNLRSFFLTNDGSKKKRIVTKNIASPESSLYLELEIIQEKIYQFDQEAKAKHLILYSKLLSLIAKKIISEYEIYKQKNALLDYDDLIIYTQNLLTNSYAKEWVLYKLDGGIDHLLVDEAQDTSKSQWRIIEALIEEFYSGESNNPKNRTIFVVGDEKQSIFSFQGADITTFSHMNKFLHEKLGESKKSFETINLDISYRSTKEILTVVADIFNKIIKSNPVDFQGNLPEMMAHRSDHSGGIEFWPLTLSENNKVEKSIWPIEKVNLDSAKIILAKKIAAYVKEQLNSGRTLPSTGQKISAKDFLILFRTRDEFTNEVIKALKDAKIDTTGLDRIALKKDLGIVDLLAIAKFVINPHNDLNLAALLKSPIFGLSEEELYVLAIGSGKGSRHCEERSDVAISCFMRSPRQAFGPPRDDDLWQRLVQDDRYIKITTKLDEFVLLYKNLPLVDFFLYITDVLSYRNIIAQNDEAIDEFLALSKNYFLEHSNGMQSFIYWFEENEISIKKEKLAKNKLRIMTTHGAKGLQAPIVILCDTTKLPHLSDRFIWDDNDEMFSAKSSSYVPEFYQTLKDNQRHKAYQEYLRLLYVGLTRAEDYLVICGYQENNQMPENCWYNLARKSMQELGTLKNNGNLVYGETGEGKAEEGINVELLPSSRGSTISATVGIQPCLPNINDILSKLASLRFAKDNESAQNPLSLQYGLVFHKILEDAISSKKISNLSTHPLIATLDCESQQRIQARLQKLTSNNEFTQLLKYDVKTELSFGYKQNSEIHIGRIDLLVIKEDQITIIDYKSDFKPATNIESIPEAYLKQLTLYNKAVAEIYPNKFINCSILWLENGNLQKVI